MADRGRIFITRKICSIENSTSLKYYKYAARSEPYIFQTVCSGFSCDEVYSSSLKGQTPVGSSLIFSERLEALLLTKNK